jgi:hypothetical protein
MYSLVSAIAKPISGGGRWLNVDIGDQSFATLFSTYSRVIATLSNPFDPANTSLDLANIEWTIADPSITFNQFLTANGNKTLPTSTTLPVISTKYLKYSDGFRAGYHVTPISPNAAPDSQLPSADKTWLYLTKAQNNWALWKKSCMVSVNGFFHFIDADSNGGYVRDGMMSRTISRQNQIGMYSFAELGSLSYVDITPSMIYKPNPALGLKDGMYINVGQDISNKTVMLVLGGYLHVLDSQTFVRVSDHAVKIDINNLPLLKRYYESVNYLDLSSLGLEKSDSNPTHIAVNQLYSDSALTAYATLSQSFIVLLDNTEVFREMHDVRSLHYPGVYISGVDPKYPLVMGVGRVAEYWPEKEVGQWSLRIHDPYLYNRRFYTTDPMQENSVDAANVTDRPYVLSPAQFLMLGSDVAAGT